MNLEKRVESSALPPASGNKIKPVWWLAIILPAILIRVPFAMEPGITGDEANYALIARCDVHDMLTGAALDNSNPPLYMLVLHGLMSIAGNRIWAWKLMSVGMNVAAIAWMILLFRRWVGAKTALFAGMLAVIHPWQTYMATEVRGYALVGLCAAVALEAADRFERRGSINAVALWAIACAAGFWTHYSMGAVALVTGIYTLVRIRRNPRRTLMWCVAGAAAIAIMALWLPTMRLQVIQRGGEPEHLWQLAGLPIVQCLGTTYLRPAVPLAWMAAAGLAAAIVYGPVGLLGGIKLFRVHRGALLLVVGLLVATIVTPLVRSAAIGSLAFSTRYTFVANATMLLLVACGLTVLRPRLRSVVTVCIVLLSCASLAQFRWMYVGRSFWPEIVAKARAEIQDGEAVLFPSMIPAMRARFFSGGGFVDAFVEGIKETRAGFVAPDATWLDVTAARYRPETFFAAEAYVQLHTFDVVWYWDLKSTDAVPLVLATAYEFDRLVPLSPLGRFGAERSPRLVRFQRVRGKASARRRVIPFEQVDKVASVIRRRRTVE